VRAYTAVAVVTVGVGGCEVNRGQEAIGKTKWLEKKRAEKAERGEGEKLRPAWFINTADQKRQYRC